MSKSTKKKALPKRNAVSRKKAAKKKPAKKKKANKPTVKEALAAYVPPPIPVVTIPSFIKLTFETIPGPLHGRSLKNLLPPDVWDIIRRKCYRLADYKCEICGDNGKNQGRAWPVECHERWEYDDVNLIQKLVGFIALCPRCHLCKHPGYANHEKLGDEMWAHFHKINGPRTSEMELYLKDHGRLVHARSIRGGWDWDVSYGSEYAGVPVVPRAFNRPIYGREMEMKSQYGDIGRAVVSSRIPEVNTFLSPKDRGVVFIKITEQLDAYRHGISECPGISDDMWNELKSTIEDCRKIVKNVLDVPWIKDPKTKKPA